MKSDRKVIATQSFEEIGTNQRDRSRDEENITHWIVLLLIKTTKSDIRSGMSITKTLCWFLQRKTGKLNVPTGTKCQQASPSIMFRQGRNVSRQIMHAQRLKEELQLQVEDVVYRRNCRHEHRHNQWISPPGAQGKTLWISPREHSCNQIQKSPQNDDLDRRQVNVDNSKECRNHRPLKTETLGTEKEQLL
jgi:hypothetical protein